MISNNERFEKQIQFVIEVDKIKNIIRKSKLFDGSKFENDAEHSWTIVLMAVLFQEYANVKIDLTKVMIMLLIHDIVEVDAGDTFLYAKERESAHVKEETAAKRLFGILEADQRDYFLELWKEFEERKTDEAKFAAVFDRIEPLLQNYLNEGYTWKQNDIDYAMVMEKNKHICEGSEEIWHFIEHLLTSSVEKGYLAQKGC